MGLERLGFYGDTRAALRAGPYSVLLEPTAGVSRTLCAWGSGSESADWSLHTAGPDSPHPATRLQLLVSAAIGSVSGRAQEGWRGPIRDAGGRADSEGGDRDCS